MKLFLDYCFLGFCKGTKVYVCLRDSAFYTKDMDRLWTFSAQHERSAV